MIIVTLDAFRQGFQERFFLAVSDQFKHPMIDGPDTATDAALDDIFIETLCVQTKVELFVISFADRTSHDASPMG
jgi:hypothetical protein